MEPSVWLLLDVSVTQVPIHHQRAGGALGLVQLGLLGGGILGGGGGGAGRRGGGIFAGAAAGCGQLLLVVAVRLDVFAEVVAAHEAFVADRAGEAFFSGVRA